MAIDKFDVKICAPEDQELRPETMPLRQLIDVLAFFEKSVRLMGRTPRDAQFALVGISEGSEKLEFVSDDRYVGRLQVLNRAIASRDFSRVPVAAHGEMRRFGRYLSKRKWLFTWPENSRLGFVPCTIRRARDLPPVPKEALVKGIASVYGELIDIGGKTPRARIACPDGTELSVRLKRSAATKLAKRLYQPVGFKGIATWVDSDEAVIRHFRAESILPFKPIALTDAFQELAELSEGAWDDVDPDEYVREVRGQDVQ